MNVNIKYTDDVQAVLTVELAKSDYEAETEKALRSYRSKVDMPGFRKGHVPLGIVKKRFGLAVKAEEINKKVGEAMYEFISAEKLHVLGEPMPQEDAPELDFATTDDFTFVFDLAIAPKLNAELGKDDKIEYYRITVSDTDIDEQITRLRKQYSTSEDAEAYEDGDILKGRLTQLEDGEAKDGGIDKADTTLMPKFMKDAVEKAKFESAKRNTVITVNLHKAYEGNAYELSSLLGVDRKDVELYTDAEFAFEIESISHRKDAEFNDEFFAMAFAGQDDVKDEASLREWLRTTMNTQLEEESDYRFQTDMYKRLLSKNEAVAFPIELLKRWYALRNKEMSAEDVEANVTRMLPSLTESLLRDLLAEKYSIAPDKDEIMAFAARITRARFAQYGLNSVPDELLNKYVSEMLNDKNQSEQIYMKVIDMKLARKVKEEVSLEEKTVTQSEYQDMVAKENEQQVAE